jgi:hypothetical protein
MSGASVTSIQPGANVVQLRPRDECPVTAALTDLAARVRRGEIVSLSVVFITAEGVVCHEQLCSSIHSSGLY